jgi:hypothetical protein
MTDKTDLQKFIEWCRSYTDMPESLKNSMLQDALEEIKQHGFDNLSSNIYLRLISFYTCKLLDDKSTSKYVPSLLNNSNIDMSSLDTMYKNTAGLRELSKSLIKFNKGYKTADGEYLKYLQRLINDGV